MFVFHMNRAFGQFPVELNQDHVERLEGMAATWTDVSVNPYDTLVRAIKRFGSIRVWFDYPENAAKTDGT